MTIDLLLMILSLYKVTEDWKLLGLKLSSLMHVLIRDQTIYFTMYINPFLLSILRADILLEIQSTNSDLRSVI